MGNRKGGFWKLLYVFKNFCRGKNQIEVEKWPWLIDLEADFMGFV